MTTKLLIADSHYLVRQGLHAIFDAHQGFEVVGETEHLERLVDLIGDKQPDVVIIGLNIQGISAVEVIEEIRNQFPDKRILVLDTNEDTSEIIQILRLGVHSYILKQCDHQEILDAVQSIMAGKNFFCSNVIKLNKNQFRRDDTGAESATIRLSERELQILELISQGLTNKEIADRTFISTHTVASHRKNLMKKFGAKNNVDLVISAIKENFIAF